MQSDDMLDILVEVRTNQRNLNEVMSMSAFDVNNSFIHFQAFQADKEFKPIEMRSGDLQVGREGERFHTNQPGNANTLIIRGQIPEEKLEELKRQENVVDVYTNPKGVIAPMAESR
ncbi:hypothetical protein HMSSN036_67480 [Paenibacillus macerans]|nr:hypothetical protein HMSSN036_67480 [Paenibacillus macerans]